MWSEQIANPYAERVLTMREVDLTLPDERERTERFLRSRGLRPDSTPDYLAAVFDEDGEMAACGGLEGNIIKWLAVSPALQGEGVAARIVTRLLAVATSRGLTNLRVFTLPVRRSLFESMGFKLIGSASQAVFLEKDARALPAWLERIPRFKGLQSDDTIGAIVMNANPFTLGHLHLVRRALETADRLYLFVLGDHELTLFPAAERRAMIVAALTANGLYDRVTVVDAAGYCISRATFPSYFKKDLDEAAEAQIGVDLDIFTRHIAPALDIRVRFVGTEPSDRLTARYNEVMKQTLPAKGIKVVETERLCTTESGTAISASTVRAQLTDHLAAALRAVPSTSRPYLLASAAEARLHAELSLTPKPGLVDRADNGAHSDMDFRLMEKSIRALRPYFVRLALLGQEEAVPDHERLAAVGKEAEAAMLRATGGVNTHRGALFALGLALAAATAATDIPTFRKDIQRLAAGFPQPADSHGGRVLARYHAKGALAVAREGYPQLFNEWLPFYRQHKDNIHRPYLLLLKIMATLDDTNVLHRVGPSRAKEVKEEATRLLADFSVSALEELNAAYIREHISPGGAADMWSLTTFIASLLPDIP